MRGRTTWLAGVAPLLLARAVGAEPVFTGRVSLTGLFYAESDGITSDGTDMAINKVRTKLATSAMLAYGEVRGVLEGKRLWRDRLDLRLDLRLRGTGTFAYERKFDNTDANLVLALQQNPALSLGVSARGYLGGPEFDLREAYGLVRLTDRYTVQLGRMFVREADGAKLDGARLFRRFGNHWEGSVFVGGYPNPYSRSLLSDYTPPCGPGVAGARDQTILESAEANPNRLAPCQGIGPQLGLGAGLGARYDYNALWGYVGLVGTIFGGPGDGGPVQPLATPDVTNLNTLEPPSDRLDAPRIYLAWLNAWRPLERLDLFSDLVFDLYGGAGPQVTRAVGFATLRLLREDRLTLRLGYTHLSSLAINMYLNRMLYNRRSGATLSLADLSMVENNLTVLRTGRHELRATADVRLGRKLGLYLDGRLRHRRLIGGDGDPAVYEQPVYTRNTSNLAGDITVGARDLGSIKDIRAALAYTALFNFRAMNHVVVFDLGRDVLGEKLTLDLQYVFAYTRDNGLRFVQEQVCASTDPFLPVCYGLRSGTTHELGLTATANPWRRIFLLLDYRFIAMLTDRQETSTEDIPTVLSHGLLVRGEYRW
ncbi:MAG: hypothetical protein RMK29_17850 [Myxococcales bacterium]|nr:hypothetical protein [Myxococcota bacterium]MDW8283575.1 hypothetical protein [Myxococcales bacterium]